MIGEKLLTLDEVAERLQVGRQRVWRLARDGELPAIRISARSVRFDPADVARYVDSRRTHAG